MYNGEVIHIEDDYAEGMSSTKKTCYVTTVKVLGGSRRDVDGSNAPEWPISTLQIAQETYVHTLCWTSTLLHTQNVINYFTLHNNIQIYQSKNFKI